MYYSKQFTPPPIFNFAHKWLLLFSLFWLTLSLASNPAHAQIPGSGGLGGGLPGYGSSPSWHITLSSSGKVTATTSAGPQIAVWNTPDESRLSSLSLTSGQSATITTAGTYYVHMEWLMPDGSAPPTAGYGSPPRNVLVDAICNMTWGGSHNVSSGSAINGLGTPEKDTYTFMVNFGGESGEKYEVHIGTSGTIDYKIDVMATVSGTMLNPGYVGVGRSLNVSANPIMINLSGTTPDPNKNNVDSILTGQRCMSSLYTMTPLVEFVNEQWSVMGDTFDSFFVSNDQTSGHEVFCAPSNWTSSYPQWCWSDTGAAGAVNGDGTISISANVVVNGVPSGPLTDSRPVTLWAPYSKMKPIVAVPISTSFDKGDGGTGPQAGVYAQDLIGGAGITFEGRCGTEDLFSQNGVGQACFVQILWLNRTQYTTGSNQANQVVKNNALDTIFPFNPAFDANNSDDASVPGSHAPGKAYDLPGMGFLWQVRGFQAADNYRMFMMYLPPNSSGGTSQWVPIQKVDWQWNTSGSRDALSSAPFAPDPPVGGVTAGAGVPTLTFPWWDNKYAGRN